MKRSILAAALASMALAACGGGGDSDQDKVASILLAEAKRDGMDADEACVKEVAGKLSDEDAKKVLALDENDDIEDAGLSAEGFSTAVGVLNCVDVSAFIDEAIAGMKAQGLLIDEQCVRDAFEGVDFSQFTAAGDVPPGLQEALIGCATLGS